MKVRNPYRCDYCLNLKGNTNHWWLRPRRLEHFALLRWDEQMVDQDCEHICSESCATKALSKWMAQAIPRTAMGCQDLSGDLETTNTLH